MKTIEHLFQSIIYQISNITDCNRLINGKSFFDIPIKNGEETYEKIIEMGRNNDYTTSNLLDYELNLLRINCNRFKLTNWIRKLWLKVTN